MTHLISVSGTKSDLSIGSTIVRTEEGERLRRKINANQFLECSAKNNDNINEVIYEAVRASVRGLPEDEPTDCCWSASSRILQRISSYLCSEQK